MGRRGSARAGRRGWSLVPTTFIRCKVGLSEVPCALSQTSLIVTLRIWIDDLNNDNSSALHLHCQCNCMWTTHSTYFRCSNSATKTGLNLFSIMFLSRFTRIQNIRVGTVGPGAWILVLVRMCRLCLKLCQRMISGAAMPQALSYFNVPQSCKPYVDTLYELSCVDIVS